MDAELMAGIYNSLVKLIHTKGKTFFTEAEIAESPVGEGFCTLADLQAALKFMSGMNFITKKDNTFTASKPNYNMSYIGEEYRFIARDNT